MPEAGSLSIDLILNSAKFAEGMAKASAAMSSFEKSAKGISKGFTKFGKQLDGIGESMTKNLTLPIAAAGVAIGAAVVKMADYGSSINDMAVRTGFSRESLQELKFAADQTGVSMESIEGSTRKLTKAMGEAAVGGKVADTFKQLGIEVKNADGSLRPANEVFIDTLDALSRIPDEATRNVIGMQLLGKSAGDLTPLVVAGKDGLNAFSKEARDAGLVMSEDAVIAADNFGDKMDKLQSQLSHAGMEIGVALMPVIEKLIGFIEGSVIPAIKKFSNWFSNLSDSQKTWIVGAVAAAAAIGPLIMAFGSIASAIGTVISIAPAMGAAWVFITGPIGLITVAVTAAVAAIGYLVKSAADAAGGFGNLWNYIKEVFVNLTRYAQAYGKVLKGVFTLDMDTINMGLNGFAAAVKLGEKNTLASWKALSQQAQAAEEAANKTKELGSEQQKTNNETVKSTLNIGLLNKSLDNNKVKLNEVKTSAQETNIDLSQLGDSWWTLGTRVEETTPILTTATTEISKAMVDMSGVINDAINNTAASVGEAVGAMLSGTGKIGGVLNSIMNGIADFVGNFGKAMIAASTAAMLAKAALATPASLAAGAALVGLSVVLKNVIATNPMGFAEGGLVMGETLGLIGEGRGTTRSNPEVVAPLDKLMGFMGDTGGNDGGKQVEFIISGETLRGVLRKNNDSRRFLGNG